jgi:hypothetical protein
MKQRINLIVKNNDKGKPMRKFGRKVTDLMYDVR